MPTATQPTIEQCAQALLVLAEHHRLHDDAKLELMARALLPNTEPARGKFFILGIAGHLEQAAFYRASTVEDAANWFGDTCGAAALADELHERAKVWQGEAETLALNAVMFDRHPPARS